MCKFPPLVAISLSFLLAGCQTPLFSDGLFSSLNPRKTLTAEKSSSDADRSVSATKPRIGGRGWRNAASRAAEQESKAQVTSLNNVERLREFLAKGNAAMQSGQYDNARIQYETILSLEPQHATAHHMLGRINDMARKFDDAERHYLAALSANREDGYLLSDLGYSYLQQGRLDEAKKYLTQAITREPDLAVAKVNLAAVYAYGGDHRGALAWLREVGSEQQAQETLASITSKPAPWVVNGASGVLADSREKYSINKDGQVLDANGEPLTTWEEVQAAMKEIRQQGNQTRRYEHQLQEFRERERINRAMAQQSGYDRRAEVTNQDANLNSQMQAIAQTSGSGRQSQLNSRPIYIDPPGQEGGPTQGNAPEQYAPEQFSPGQYPTGQFPPQNNAGATPETGWNPQNRNQQYPSGNSQRQYPDQRNSYSGLLNPAGPAPGAAPSGFPQQHPSATPPNRQHSTVPPQFPGIQQIPGQTPQFASNGNPGATHQNQYAEPQYQGGSGYGPPQRFGPAPVTNGTASGINPALQQYPSQNGGTIPNSGHPQPTTPSQVDQYGHPVQPTPPANPAWNGQPSGHPVNPGSTAPNPGYFGQSHSPGNVNPQSGSFVNNPQQPIAPQNITGQSGQDPVGNSHYQQTWNPQPGNAPTYDQQTSGQQPIQQLSYDSQTPLARIDRGQRITQYSDADRQATQLGMAAGFGPLAPIATGSHQSAPQNQMPPDQVQSNYGHPNAPPQLNWPPDSSRQGSPGTANTFGQPQGRNSQTAPIQPQRQLPNQEYPGAVPATSRQLPGQTSFQAPNRQVHGQSIADQTGQDPQTAQPWLRMPTSQADVTMPAAFSSTTQPVQQQSQNYQRPEVVNQAWQNGVLSSPTTRPGFGQPHMTSPFLRPADAQTGQAENGQSVQTALWPSRQ